MQVMRARLLGFQGQVTEALAVLDAIDFEPGIAELLVAATRCLLVGNNAQRQSVRSIADRLERELGAPHDYISAGCYILVSYGLIAASDIARAAKFVLAAGRTPSLANLSIIDRALGLEMLVAAAVAENDLDAAQAWRLQAAPLLEQTIAAPTIERINSRVELLAGNATTAAEWAEKALAHALADGRAVEAAEGEIVLSRARIALSERGVASSRLEAMAAQAVSSGHLAAQKSAADDFDRRPAADGTASPPANKTSHCSSRRDLATRPLPPNSISLSTRCRRTSRACSRPSGRHPVSPSQRSSPACCRVTRMRHLRRSSPHDSRPWQSTSRADAPTTRLPVISG
jgi:hypothetical protein